MITLLHGPDDLLRSEHLATLRAALGPAEMAELSTTWLDGRRTTIGEIRHHADAMPFLTPRRLVIVEGYLLQLRRRMRSSKGKTDDEGDDSDTPENLSAAAQDREHLLAYLSEVPDTTDLVLVEATTVPGNDKLIKALKRLANEGRAAIVVCDAPAERDLPGWIIDRTRRKGGEIEPAAAYDLATSVGRNLMLLDNELDKLIAYGGGAGPIRKTDVRLMVPYTQEASIFDMVDAIGQKNSAEATRLLRELEREKEQRSHTPEGLIQEMELRLYDYGREVEGRVETTLHVLDRLIRDAEHEIGRLEEVLQASRGVQPEPEINQRISCLIETGLTDAEIAACLGCSQETIEQWRQHPGRSGDTRVA